MPTFFSEESRGLCGLSRLWQQNYNLKIKSCLDEAVQILQSFQLSVEQAVTLSSAGRKGTKKRKRDRLGPFSNPHEVPVQEAVRNHRACKSPCGEFVRGGSVSLLQVNLLRGRQFARCRLRPPLSFAHSGVSRSKPRGSRGVVCQWQTLNTDRAGRRDWCNPLPVFAYFLLGRKYERQIKKTGFALAQNGPFSKGQGLFRE